MAYYQLRWRLKMAEYESFAFEAKYKIRKGKNKAGKWFLLNTIFIWWYKRIKELYIFFSLRTKRFRMDSE